MQDSGIREWKLNIHMCLIISATSEWNHNVCAERKLIAYDFCLVGIHALIASHDLHFMGAVIVYVMWWSSYK